LTDTQVKRIIPCGQVTNLCQITCSAMLPEVLAFLFG
jgi:hypothetical protein